MNGLERLRWLKPARYTITKNVLILLMMPAMTLTPCARGDSPSAQPDPVSTIITSTTPVASAATAAISASSAVWATPPPVAIKDIPAQRVAYLEHVGAYWRVGPMISTMLDYLDRHRLQAPLFVRYLDHPTSVTPDSLRAWIGFEIPPDHQPDGRFQEGQIEGERVVYVEVQGGFVAPSRYYARLDAWAKAHGFEVSGPITEIYRSSPEISGRAMKQPLMEIQATVYKRRIVPTPRQNMVSPPETPSPSTPPDLTPPDLAPPGRFEDIKMTLPQSGLGVALSQPTTENTADEEVDQIPENPQSSLHSSRQPPFRSSTDKPSLSIAKSSSWRAVEESQSEKLQNTVSTELTMAELIRSGHFEQLAEQLIPKTSRNDPIQRAWISQVVLRVKTIARGLERLYPTETPVIQSISRTLADRYQQVFGTSINDVVVWDNKQADSPNDQKATTWRSIVASLDSMIMQLARRQIDARSVEKVVIEQLLVVQKIQFG